MGMIGDHQETVTIQPKQEPIPSTITMPSIAPATAPTKAPELVPA